VLSAESVFREVIQDDESFRLFMSLAAKGEAQGGFENERIADLCLDPVLAAKIRRHGADEAKHARIFERLLAQRGLEPLVVPLELDYTMQLERAGIGLSHERLVRDAHLSNEELLIYLAHSRVTEQRGAEEVFQQRKVFASDRALAKAFRLIADDEANHLSYVNEELAAFRERGHAATIQGLLDRYAREEVRIYGRVGSAVVAHLGEILGWSRARIGILRLGLGVIGASERSWRWRRLTREMKPERPGAMAPAGA